MSERELLPGLQPDGSWVLSCDHGVDYGSLMAAAVGDFRVRHDLPHEETLAGAQTFSAEEDVQVDRAAQVLARCLPNVQDRNLERFAAGFHRLFRMDLPVALLIELRKIAREATT